MDIIELRNKISADNVDYIWRNGLNDNIPKWKYEFRWDMGEFIESKLYNLTYELDDLYSKMRSRLQELKPKKNLDIYYENIKIIEDAIIGTTFVIKNVFYVKIGKACFCDHSDDTSLLNLNTFRAGLHFSKIVPYDEIIRRI